MQQDRQQEHLPKNSCAKPKIPPFTIQRTAILYEGGWEKPLLDLSNQLESKIRTQVR